MNSQDIIIASGPVIIEDGKVLLNKHGDDAFWKFLGGKVEDFDFADETMSLEVACKREAKEENGIDIEIICPLKPMMVKKVGTENTWVVLIHYLAKRTNEVQLAKDTRDFKSFDVEKLVHEGYPDEAFAPNIIPVLQDYKEKKARGIYA